MSSTDENSAISLGSATDSGEQNISLKTSPLPQTGFRKTTAARLEDIVAARPISQRPLADGSAIGKFRQRLSAVAVGGSTRDDVLSAAAAALTSLPAIQFVAWADEQRATVGNRLTVRGLTGPIDSQTVAIQQAIQSLVSEATAASEDLASVVDRAICAQVRHADGLLIAVTSNDTTRNLAVPTDTQLAVELTAAAINEWQLQSQHSQSEQEMHHVAAMIDLVSRISGCRDVDEAARCITEDLKEYLQATDAYLATQPVGGRSVRMLAVSGSEPDPTSEVVSAAESVLQESVARDASSIWPSVDAGNRHALLSHQQFAESHDTAEIVACPLRNEHHEVFGAVMITFADRIEGPAGEARSTSAASFLSAAETPLATALVSLRRASQGTIAKIKDQLRPLWKGNRLRVLAATIAVIGLTMLFPVDYRVTCDSELQPVSRRFVAAPFDAPLKECLVEPGDVVEAGQLLAVLDGRELSWELAGIRADLGKANKEHNAFLSERKSGEAAIARHEIDRLQNKTALLTDRTANLEIRSPISGILVAGDLKDTEGVPLETGQSLFEVAPLDRMVMEVAIPEEDVRHILPGMTVRLRLDAKPSETLDATIVRMHPKAELRDHENVFIAEAELDNSQHELRPGMRGQAKVSAGRRMLGWTLLHKPTAHIVGWLGW